ncbi:MAG: hypothetical protein EP338_00945 [Bacteroidetes bacterium]|nr:MAG: hypothetical protein EP338_00945 [Bacteroidota bacterium]
MIGNQLRFILAFVLSGVFLVLTIYLVALTKKETTVYKHEKEQVIKILNFSERLLSFRDWVFSEQAWEEKKTRFEEVNQRADQAYLRASSYSYYLLGACALFLLIMLVLFLPKKPFFGLSLATIILCIPLLAQGLFNPMMELSAYKENLTIKLYVKPNDIPQFREAVKYLKELDHLASYIEIIPIYGKSLADDTRELFHVGSDYLDKQGDKEFGKDQVFPGKTYFYYQNKGILDVVSLLWNQGSKTIACAISLFSLIIPFFKLSFSLLFLFSRTDRFKRLKAFMSKLSKWSMADVFVIGIFMSYLSFNQMSPGVEVDAGALLGLYFFVAYVLVSLSLSYSLKRAEKERSRQLYPADQE